MNDVTPRKIMQFPCQFNVKVMGNNDSQLEQTALSIIKKHAADFNGEISRRPSKDGNYIGLTFTINATSQQQLDTIYHELSQHPDIKMAL